jgi:hypothetical protein
MMRPTRPPKTGPRMDAMGTPPSPLLPSALVLLLGLLPLCVGVGANIWAWARRPATRATKSKARRASAAASDMKRVGHRSLYRCVDG